MAVISIPAERANIIVPAMRRGIASALNKVMRKASTEASKQVRKVYNIKARDIKDKTSFRKANVNRSVASFSIQSSRLKLLFFDAQEKNITIQVKTKKGKVYSRGAKEVSIEVKKGSRKVVKGGFVGQTSSGYINIFKRIDKERYPIESRTSLAVASMYNTEGEKAVDKIFNEQFLDIMSHEIDFRLSKI